MHTEDTNALIEQRKAKLAALRARGIDPFANKFKPDIGCGEARAKLQDGSLAEGAPVAVAGRIVAHRDMGKSQFLDLKDYTGRVQIYAQKNALGDIQFDVLKHIDLGDFIGARGTMFRTRSGEPSVRVESFVVLSKALRPPPGQWYGLAEPETRYRQRYLDLMVNDDVAHVFRQRSRIISAIRSFLESRGFIEVETPVMQAIAGGAAAKPFVTHHNALGCDFYLRISLELYLKRLLVGGFDRVFEIGRNFRNEGISRKHNPEFTMLEAYQAYGDYETMMELVESMVCHVAREIVGSLLIKHLDKEGKVVRQIDLTPPWRRVKYKELVRQRAGSDWFEIAPEQRRQRAIELGADIE
ncbi:MAG: lysine--tRNA ligase, partial [Verrucomicrobiia bacterium]